MNHTESCGNCHVRPCVCVNTTKTRPSCNHPSAYVIEGRMVCANCWDEGHEAGRAEGHTAGVAEEARHKAPMVAALERIRTLLWNAEGHMSHLAFVTATETVTEFWRRVDADFLKERGEHLAAKENNNES